MKNVLISLFILVSGSFASAQEDLNLLCSADKSGTDFKINIKSHSVHEISQGKPRMRHVVSFDDQQAKGGDNIVYSLDDGAVLYLSNQGEWPNEWSLFSEQVGSGNCLIVD